MMVTSSGRSRLLISAIVLVVVFLALRLPGIDLPYHQDEWKNVSASATVEGAGNFFAHPPLMQIIFVAGRALTGEEYMRAVPLVFSIAAGVLLWFAVARRLGRSAAWWTAALYAICAYNIHGALSPDVDGAILPFFFLLALAAYDKWLLCGRARWLISLIAVLLTGLLVKLSFIIVIGVFIVDYLLQNRHSLNVKRSLYGLGAIFGFVAVYTALLYLFQAAYPAFSISLMLNHARDSAGDIGRNWMQIIVQSAKAAYLLSPLLIMPLLWSPRELWNKARPFSLYVILGLLFYLAIFDFSRTALDKYLLFLIVPLTALAGASLARMISPETPPRLPFGAIVAGILISAGLVALNMLPHETVPLYPKAEWFSRVLRGEWNILNPFTGGNGPMGFYVSFLFIAASFVISLGVAIAGLAKREWRSGAVIIMVIIGVAYNAIFAEEMLYGRINGSAPAVLGQTVAYIERDQAISQVLTYNDIGAGELSRIGKYAGRFYAAPDYEDGHRQRFADFAGHYLVVDVPRLYDGFYTDFFAECEVLYMAHSQNITGRVYDCSSTASIINKGDIQKQQTIL